MPTPGVVPALHMLVSAFASPGDTVLVQRPVYYPFFGAVTENGCRLVSNSLVLDDGRYCMDLDDLEEKAADPRCKLAILCNPHNPVGRVWTATELKAFGEICRKHDVLVVADEIHGDLVYSGHTFTPYATLDPDLADRCITCTAPSKTFNLAGLQTSNIIISNPELRLRFKQVMKANGIFGLNPFGMAACRAAYNQGEAWLAKLLSYLEGNRDALCELFAREVPHIPVIATEGTYLSWFDCRALGLDPLALRDLMVDRARVVLDEGYIFGPEGRGFERINIACPRPVLLEAAQRIIQALRDHGA
jgi:cystathionine beta-lyase